MNMTFACREQLEIVYIHLWFSKEHVFASQHVTMFYTSAADSSSNFLLNRRLAEVAAAALAGFRLLPCDPVTSAVDSAGSAGVLEAVRNPRIFPVRVAAAGPD